MIPDVPYAALHALFLLPSNESANNLSLVARGRLEAELVGHAAGAEIKVRHGAKHVR